MGLGSVIGYLFAGIAISPILHKLQSDTEMIRQYAEFGVVIMMFLVGLEMQPQKIWKIKENLLGLGGLQIILTTLVFSLIAILFGTHWKTSIAMSTILALSSTAIVLQILKENNLGTSPKGQSAVSVLLMQDIAVIPLLALFPLLALPDLQLNFLLNAAISGEPINENISIKPTSNLPNWALAIVLTLGITSIILIGKYLTNPLLTFISNSKLKEVFLATTLLMIISVSYLMHLVGLSAALGTFLVGLVLSTSKFRHSIALELEPFKGLLLGLFFITVGASINFSVLFNNFLFIIGLTIGMIVIKTIILFFLCRFFLINKKSSLFIALSLSQAGEFGFVLLTLSNAAHVLPNHTANILAVVIALSMVVTPLLIVLYKKSEFLIKATE